LLSDPFPLFYRGTLLFLERERERLYFLQCKTFTSMNIEWKPCFFLIFFLRNAKFLFNYTTRSEVRREWAVLGLHTVAPCCSRVQSSPVGMGCIWASTPFILSREFLNQPVCPISTSPYVKLLSLQRKKEEKKRGKTNQDEAAKEKHAG